MRIAILSDIHGNRTAFEAVLADLREASPDLVLHGGDLADSGASPVEIVDQIRSLGWQGVVGNTDELLFRPESLQEFASQSAQLQPLFALVEEMAAATREALGEERLKWLSELPPTQNRSPMALVHGSPGNTWRAPGPEATDTELESAYASLDKRVTVYAHIHRPYIRTLTGAQSTHGLARTTERTVVNTGSVGLSYDGDRRAAYLLLDDGHPSIRRVEYDLDKELKALSTCKLPHAGWIAKTLASGRPQMP
jgi:predicted phosphodiesterase